MVPPRQDDAVCSNSTLLYVWGRKTFTPTGPRFLGGVSAVAAISVILANLIADLVYGYLDLRMLVEGRM
jgi:hypothetical protein